jgi:dGTPase
MINTLVVDLLEQTRANIAAHTRKAWTTCAAAQPLAAFSEGVLAQHRELKRFLFQNLYRHYKVVRMSEKAQRLLRDLFTRSPANRV